MFEQKQTEAEIKKGLENAVICIGQAPFVEKVAKGEQLKTDLLDLLNRKDAEIERLQKLVDEMGSYFPSCIDCAGKTSLGERTDECVYCIDNTNFCAKRGIENIAKITKENDVLKADNKRLRKFLDMSRKVSLARRDENIRKDKTMIKMSEELKAARAEAIKEFADNVFEEIAVYKFVDKSPKYRDGFIEAINWFNGIIDNIVEKRTNDIYKKLHNNERR